MAEWFVQFRALMEDHNFRQVAGRASGCNKFQKDVVSVETCDDAQIFEVRYPGDNGTNLLEFLAGFNQLEKCSGKIGY
jgi:hypothetical protein